MNFPASDLGNQKDSSIFFLREAREFLEEMTDIISNLKREIRSCDECSRFFQKNHSDSPRCEICSDKNRDTSKIMIVCRDVDLETVEKSGSYNGMYFVLGGSVPILEKNRKTK